MKYFGRKIRFLYNCFRQRLERNEVIQKSSFSRTEFMVLATVINSEKLLCLKDIQERFSINRSSASELLSGLEYKGAIIKQVDDNDSRVKYIIITESGKEEFKKIAKQFDSINEYLTSCLTNEEKNELNRLLDKLIDFNMKEKEGEKDEEIYCSKKKEN